MIIQKHFLDRLKDFGLNTYESKLWAALLSRGVSTAGELSDIANVPRSRSYDVLESLEKKGFIIMKIGKPIKYIAVPPSEVLERVKKKVLNDAEKQSKTLDNLKSSEVLSELNTLHTQGVEAVEPSEISGSLKGRNNIHNHLDSMIKSAEKSVVLMTTSSGLLRKADVLKSALEKAKQRGVKVKIAAPLSNETENAVKSLKGLAEVKHTEKIQSRFCVVDGKEVMFMLLNDTQVHPTYDVGVWLNTEFFASALNNLFEESWSKMKASDVILK
ncbi:hypothetical protein KY339_00210 [Candidatus Woesearchaeota archaeon]|nr:hypothetical protein [Candidatus Woesearchaeota archaeon]